MDAQRENSHLRDASGEALQPPRAPPGRVGRSEQPDGSAPLRGFRGAPEPCLQSGADFLEVPAVSCAARIPPSPFPLCHPPISQGQAPHRLPRPSKPTPSPFRASGQGWCARSHRVIELSEKHCMVPGSCRQAEEPGVARRCSGVSALSRAWGARTVVHTGRVRGGRDEKHLVLALEESLC